MKKQYVCPNIRIKSVESEDTMESISMMVIDSTKEEEMITESNEILGNTNSVWDD